MILAAAARRGNQGALPAADDESDTDLCGYKPRAPDLAEAGDFSQRTSEQLRVRSRVLGLRGRGV